MNFLAHALLSGNDRDVLAGNLLADFVRGRAAIAALPAGVRRGVALHRHIDAFTDAHGATRRSVVRIKPRWGRYSPILVDVFYDHYLAREWNAYSTRSLREVADEAYAALRAIERAGVADADTAVRVIVAPDRLTKYATADGVRDALHRISTQRLRRDAGLERAVDDMLRLDAELAGDFRELFAELWASAERWQTENP